MTSSASMSFEQGWPILQEEAVNKVIDMVEGTGQYQFSSEDYMRIYTYVSDLSFLGSFKLMLYSYLKFLFCLFDQN